MKKIILIPDSFKGTMRSDEFCAIAEQAIRVHYPDIAVVSLPVADGGEGSVDCFLQAMSGTAVTRTVQNPFGEPVECRYGLFDDGKTAVIEMAAAAGLPLVENRKNPLTASTFGVGQLMVDAAQHGATRIIVGLGGSATNDGGCGAAAAAGIRFYNKDGALFVPAGGTLCDIDRIDCAALDPQMRGAKVITMCDIDNPLFGTQGAAYIFGPQKGATPDLVVQLDDGLRHLDDCLKRDLGVDVSAVPGAGAAGGMGAGMIAFFGSELRRGIDVVLDTVGFDRHLDGADLVITGEGKIDSQSLRGKVVIGVARRAKGTGVPVIAVVGDIEDPLDSVYDEGVGAVFSINRVAAEFKAIRGFSKDYLARTIDSLFRFLKITGKE